MVKGARLWGVVALCVLSGSGWVLVQAWPSEMAWPFGACLHFGLIALVGLAVASLQRDWSGLLLLRGVLVGVAGIGLVALPAAVLQFAAGKVPEATSLAVFCAVPLMTVLAAGALGAGDGEASQLRGLMVPSVAGLGGALLLSPPESPGSLRQWLFLGLVMGCCVVVALAGVWMHRLMQSVGVAAAVAVIGLGSASALGLYGAAVGWPVLEWKVVAEEMLRCVVFDLPVVWLTVWLAREMNAARLSARFLLVPLVTVAEGYAVECGPLELKTLLAAGLLCAGGVMLLVWDEPEEVAGLGLR
jgi:hypothetical protein